VISVRLLRRAAADPALGLDVTPDWAREFAERWKKDRRVRLPRQRREPDTEFTAQISAVLSTAAGRFGSTVLLVDLPSGRSFAMRLASWAEKMSAQLSPALHDSEVAAALRVLGSGDVEGLQQLLQLPDVFVVFGDIPGLSASDEVIWEQLRTAANATIVICHDPTVEVDAMSDWSPDQLGTEADLAGLDVLFDRVAQSLGLLAIIGRPVSLTALAGITGEDLGSLAKSPALIDAPATGVVLAAYALDFVVGRLGESGLRTAHETYLQARRQGASTHPRDKRFGRPKASHRCPALA